MPSQMKRKYEWALALSEKGKTPKQIAVAINSTPDSVGGLLWYAKNRDRRLKEVPGSTAWWKARGY